MSFCTTVLAAVVVEEVATGVDVLLIWFSMVRAVDRAIQAECSLFALVYGCIVSSFAIS
jgi:hypothetical protein